MNSTADFASMYLANSKSVYLHLMRKVRNHPLAEDLTSETFLRAWRNWAGYAESGFARAWLYQVARAVTADWFRRDRVVVELEPERDAPCTWAEQDLTAVDDADWLQYVFQPLTVEQRSVMELTEQGLRPREIAERTGSTSQIVRAAKYRAMEVLRTRMAA